MTRHLSFPNYYYQIWRSKGFVIALCIILVFMMISVTKEVIRRVETRYEIQQLESEVDRLMARNTEMQTFIMMLNTSTVQDKEARIKLGMQAPGERLVILPDRAQQAEIVLPDSDRIQYKAPTDPQSNPEKWFLYFRDKFYKAR